MAEPMTPSRWGSIVIFVLLLGVVVLKGLMLVREQHSGWPLALASVLPFVGAFSFLFAFLLHAAATQQNGVYLPGGVAGGGAMTLGVVLGLYDPARLGIAFLVMAGAGAALVAIGVHGFVRQARRPPSDPGNDAQVG
jgi:hypothetical protein